MSILSLCVLVLTIYFLLLLPPVQQKIKDFALQEIMKITQSKISIGNLYFRSFNRLHLEEVFAADLKNDTLVYVEKLDAGFNLFKFMRKQLVIHSLEIDHFDLRVSQDSINAPFNFQFLIDAFASDTTQTTDSSSLQLAIEHILLSNGHLRYDILSEPFQKPGLFDANHIDVRNLRIKANLHFTDLEKWNSSIEHFSFKEKSGFALKQMKFRVENLNNRLLVDRFHIAFPRSEADIEEASIDYDGFPLSEILSGASYSLLFSSDKCYLSDFICFYPELSKYSDPIKCSGEIKGKFPEISIPRLTLNYGKQLQLSLSAGITNYNAWETSAFKLNVEKGVIDPALFELPVKSGIISLSGELTGSLPDLKMDLLAESEQGNWKLKGTGGYDVSSENIRFDLAAEATECNLKNLLSDTTLGSLSAQLTTQGTIAGFNKFNVNSNAVIKQLDYLGYSYRDIIADVTYAGDTVLIDLTSEDPHLPVIMQGKVGINKKNPFVQMHAQLNGVHPNTLHLVSQYPGSEISGDIRADIKGFDPERMNASVVIEGLHLKTSTGVFSDSLITFSYITGANRQKQINLRSPTLSVRGKGNLTYEGVIQTFAQAFPGLLPAGKYKKAKTTASDSDNFDFLIGIRHANAIAKLFEMETTIPDSAFFIGKYVGEGENLNLSLTAYCVFYQSDTARIKMNLSNDQNNLVVQLDARNKSDYYDLEGNMEASVEFIPNSSGANPDINIALKPGSLTMNGTAFHIHPAQIAITKNRYEISDFALQHSRSEYLKINGVLSDNRADSLQVTLNRFEIRTLLSALKNKLPLSGTASGDITLSRLMTNPLVLTRNFSIENMVFDGNTVGNLHLRSAWSSERQGLALRATWSPPNAPESVVSGFVLPKRDSLSLTANIQGIQLKWLDGYFPNYGLDGEMSAQIKA